MLNKLLDAGIADGQLVGERVDGAAVAHGIEEGHFVGHVGGAVCAGRRCGRD